MPFLTPPPRIPCHPYQGPAAGGDPPGRTILFRSDEAV